MNYAIDPDDLTIDPRRPDLLPSLELPTRVPQSASQPIRIDFGTGRSPQLVELEALLLYRLRILVLILFGGHLFFNAFRLLRLEFTPALVTATVVPALLNLGALAALATILWTMRPPYTLRRLRRLEVLLFGVSTLYLLGEAYNVLFGIDGMMLVYAQRPLAETSALGRQTAILWLSLIVAYGTFIPNTGRRCAVVTGVMASSPVILIAIAGSLNPMIPTRLLFMVLSEIVLWSGVGVAIAIYGSHKITVLREEAMAARKLGQYQLKQQLGAGGMGEVYLAEHVLLKRPCAVKVIRPDQAGDPTTLQRFLREVQVTSTLTHPNTVQVFDYGQAEDGTVYYAMEYLTGLSLDDLVRLHGPLPPGRTIALLRQLCGALAEAHGIGLIHRDIKPSNVILCSRGGVHDVAKLLDFGLVRMQASGVELTQVGLIFGTPAYMSPEQVSGKDLDTRNDIYSLGALGYFLLTGRPPFVRDTAVQVMAAHISDGVTSPRVHRDSIPPDLEAVVLRCLAKDPGDRFADVASLEQTLRACGAATEWTPSDAAVWWDVLPASGVPPA